MPAMTQAFVNSLTDLTYDPTTHFCTSTPASGGRNVGANVINEQWVTTTPGLYGFTQNAFDKLAAPGALVLPNGTGFTSGLNTYAIVVSAELIDVTQTSS